MNKLYGFFNEIDERKDFLKTQISYKWQEGYQSLE